MEINYNYKSSGFNRVIAVLAFFISIIPVMLLLTSTAYPIMNTYPEMTTIVVVTKRCFWICIVSMMCSLGILTAYIARTD